MSTIGIILIVVAVIAVLAILYFAVLSPKKRAEKRLRAEREQAASHHREVASERHQRASLAEQQAQEAKIQAQRAEQEAELARSEATAHEGRADLHEQGLADHELDAGEPSTVNGSQNVDRSGLDETTHDGTRPASLSDRDEGRFDNRDGENTGSVAAERDRPAERW